MGYEIDFLPVGDNAKSGDAIALRFGNLHGSRREQCVMVIDGGFQRTGKQLVEHIRQYYRTDRVDLVISTHPDGDHIAGLQVVLEELKVEKLWMHLPWNHTDEIERLFRDGRVTDNSVRESLRRSLEAARELEKMARRQGIPIIEPFTGVADATQSLLVLGPTREYYESLLPHFQCTPEPRRYSLLAEILRGVATATKEAVAKVFESWDVETLNDDAENEDATSAENNTSTILLLRVDNRNLLFTADAGAPALHQALDLLMHVGIGPEHFSFVQVPHHGSRRNVGPTLLDRLLGPKLPSHQRGTRRMSAFVSASKDGAPKHPSKKVTNAFARRGAPVVATQGRTICHYHDAPARPGWSAANPLPFYHEVEE